jgi:hypothetical protein
MSETQLSTDFAARVLEAADRFAARRRRARWLTGTSAVCLGMIATAVWFGLSGMSNDRKPEGTLVASAPWPNADASAGGLPAPVSRDALSFFFPDADALSRYAAKDAGDDSASSAGALLADDE